jgi:hypothetical protein
MHVNETGWNVPIMDIFSGNEKIFSSENSTIPGYLYTSSPTIGLPTASWNQWAIQMEKIDDVECDLT